MDIDFIKNGGADDQMELMLMHDFSAAYAAVNDIPMLDFAAECPPLVDHHHLPPPPEISFSAAPPPCGGAAAEKRNSMAAMREMIFRIAAMQPIHIDPESVKPPKRRNVKISTDPQSVAARHRRERISERIRILQRLVPGGTKMDTASMLDEAIHYVKFLKNQVQSLERVSAARPPPPPSSAAGMGFPVPISTGSYFPVGGKGYHHHHHHQRRSVIDFFGVFSR